MDPKIFKAYDIRGVYPMDLDEEAMYAIGRALVAQLGARRLGVGRDIRASSPSLAEHFIRGVTEAGADVLDLGIITTPMVYFASGRLDIDAAVSITASHNPPEYNGLKVCLKNAIPVGETTGLAEIRDRVIAGNFSESPRRGTVVKENICPAYYGYFASFARLGNKKLKIVIDTANAMGVYELPIYAQFGKNLEIINLYNDLGHPFECHEANPLKTETLAELQAKVLEVGANLGIAYDGDADRIGFVDEKGALVPMEITTALIARPILEAHPGSTILYDLRSSKAVREIIEENGGRALECRVGHAFIKRQMAETGAVFGGELSGHYYFQENYNAEASTLAAIMIMNLLTETGKEVSELVHEVRRYHHSGEINSTVPDKDVVLAKLKTKYADGEQHGLDGLKVEYPDWWFNVRPSNTEPLLRLNLEAETPELMEKKKSELLALIRA